MQHEILDANASADLRVYTIWFNMYPGDARWRWDGAGLTDARVEHFWDERKAVGTWFSATFTHRANPTWDFYALYSPEATWQAEPPAAVSSGGTIIGRREQLQAAIEPLLRATSAVNERAR